MSLLALPEVLLGLVLSYLDIYFVETTFRLSSRRCNRVANSKTVCNMRTTTFDLHYRGFRQMCAKYKMLRSLKLYITEWRDDLIYISDLPLTDLTVFCSRIADTDLVHLSKLPITTLRIARFKSITDAELAYLSKLPLKHLEISSSEVITNSGLVHLSKLPLVTLSLNSSNITDEGLVHLSKLPLTRLALHSGRETKLTDSGLVHLLKLPLTSLSL